MRLIIICIMVLASKFLFAQEADWQRWTAKEISYTEEPSKKTVSTEEGKKSIGSFLLGTSHSLYNFFISDLDGDNCPFYPTCSNFFIQSVKETNIFQGSLMFFDRFTRDMNLLKINHYPLTLDRSHFADPVRNYTLHSEKIKYIPPEESIKN